MSAKFACRCSKLLLQAAACVRAAGVTPAEQRRAACLRCLPCSALPAGVVESVLDWVTITKKDGTDTQVGCGAVRWRAWGVWWEWCRSVCRSGGQLGMRGLHGSAALHLRGSPLVLPAAPSSLTAHTHTPLPLPTACRSAPW